MADRLPTFPRHVLCRALLVIVEYKVVVRSEATSVRQVSAVTAPGVVLAAGRQRRHQRLERDLTRCSGSEGRAIGARLALRKAFKSSCYCGQVQQSRFVGHHTLRELNGSFFVGDLHAVMHVGDSIVVARARVPQCDRPVRVKHKCLVILAR